MHQKNSTNAHLNRGTSINLTKLSNLPVPLPPLKEQHRIVTKIEALTTHSRKARKALDTIPALLDQFRQSVLAAAFRGDLTADWRSQNPDVEPAEKLLERIRVERRAKWEATELEKMKAKGKVPKNDKWKEKYKGLDNVIEDDLIEIPAGWSWTMAEDVTKPGKSIIYGIIKPGPDTPGGVPYVRVTEMKTGVIDIKVLRRCSPERAAKFSRATLESGDILISKDGTIGKVALVPPELEGGNITQHVVRLSPSKEVYGPFLAIMIESPVLQKWLVKETKGIGLTGVNVRDFRRLPIPIPPLQEQKEIVRCVETFLVSIGALERKATDCFSQLDRLDQSILAKAFRGQLVPQDPTDEPASLLLQRIQAEREKLQKKGKGKKGKGKGGKGKGKKTDKAPTATKPSGQLDLL